MVNYGALSGTSRCYVWCRSLVLTPSRHPRWDRFVCSKNWRSVHSELLPSSFVPVRYGGCRGNKGNGDTPPSCRRYWPGGCILWLDPKTRPRAALRAFSYLQTVSQECQEKSVTYCWNRAKVNISRRDSDGDIEIALLLSVWCINVATEMMKWRVNVNEGRFTVVVCKFIAKVMDVVCWHWVGYVDLRWNMMLRWMIMLKLVESE